MTIIIPHKCGDTFRVEGQYEDSAGAPAPLTGVTVTSQIRDRRGHLISNCVVTITDSPTGGYTLLVADTSKWPVDMLQWDVQFASTAGDTVSTPTIVIDVAKDVTA